MTNKQLLGVIGLFAGFALTMILIDYFVHKVPTADPCKWRDGDVLESRFSGNEVQVLQHGKWKYDGGRVCQYRARTIDDMEVVFMEHELREAN